MMQVLNARISDAYIRLDRNEFLTAWLMLDFGGSTQGFGGYAFDTYDKEEDLRIGTAWGCEYIRRILTTLGVSDWDKLNGLAVRVKKEDGYQGKIVGVGHFIKDKWFEPERHLAFLKDGDE